MKSNLTLPIGTHVMVTGDSMGYSHCFAPDTPGVINGYGASGYQVKGRDTYDEVGDWFVHPNDVKELTSMPDQETTAATTSEGDVTYAPDVKGFTLVPEVTYDQGPVTSVHRIEALEWTLEHFPEDSVVDLVKLANWILEGEYR